MVEGLNLSSSFIMLWGHLDPPCSPGRWGRGSLQPVRCRLGCAGPPGENYSARRPLRSAPTFPASCRYRCLLSARRRTRLAREGLPPRGAGRCGAAPAPVPSCAGERCSLSHTALSRSVPSPRRRRGS